MIHQNFVFACLLVGFCLRFGGGTALIYKGDIDNGWIEVNCLGMNWEILQD